MAKKLKVAQIFLNISLVVFLLVFLGSIQDTLQNPEMSKLDRILSVFFTLTYGYFILYIIVILRQVVRTVATNNSFCEANVRRLKAIGYSIFGLGLLDAIVNFTENSGLRLIGTPYGSIHPSTFVFIVLGCLALLLSEIFAEALDIKSENDLTI